MHDTRFKFLQTALPLYRQLLDDMHARVIGNSEELHRVANVCDALLDIPDYVWGESPRPAATSKFKRKEDYYNDTRKRNRAYAIASDIANAHKHGKISRADGEIKSIADVVEAMMVVRFNDAQGEYYRNVKGVVVNLTDGKQIDVRTILHDAMFFCAHELFVLGLIPTLLPVHHLRYDPYLLRSDER